MSSQTLDWKYIVNLMSKQCHSCVIVWKGMLIYQLCLVISSLWNQVDQDLKNKQTTKNCRHALPVESGIHMDLSVRAHIPWLQSMSEMCHEIQAKRFFWLFIQSNNLLIALLKWSDFVEQILFH